MTFTNARPAPMMPGRTARRAGLAAAFAGALFLASPEAVGAPVPRASLCTADETTFFSCRLARSTKVASLGGRAGAPRPWLQYRIGVPGQAAELLVPKSIDDPDMGSRFFFDGPAATRDNSFWSVGVWFENVDTIYELQTWQEHEYREGGDTASGVIIWHSLRPQERGRIVQCDGPSSSATLEAARDVVEAMSPPWHGWAVSPEDWMSWARKRDAARRPAPASSTASSAR
jgi:hypothetical protein